MSGPPGPRTLWSGRMTHIGRLRQELLRARG
jgi:hypothetical protein